MDPGYSHMTLIIIFHNFWTANLFTAFNFLFMTYLITQNIDCYIFNTFPQMEFFLDDV